MEIARFMHSQMEGYKIVKARNISPKENDKIYRGNLYCQYTNCNAKLVYNERNERDKGEVKRYFSTLRGSSHVIGCPNRVVHESKATAKSKENNLSFYDLEYKMNKLI